MSAELSPYDETPAARVGLAEAAAAVLAARRSGDPEAIENALQTAGQRLMELSGAQSGLMGAYWVRTVEGHADD